jgi:hypothetical protein
MSFLDILTGVFWCENARGVSSKDDVGSGGVSETSVILLMGVPVRLERSQITLEWLYKISA